MFGNGLVSFLVVFLPAISVVNTLDHHKLLDQYIGVCGMNLCNSSMFEIKPDLDYTSSSSCPDCKCDNDCWLNNNCCPDLYLSFPVINKIRTNVYPITNGSSEDKYEEMISTCPAEHHACEVGPTLLDLLNNVPVFAGPYSLPFRSACYARCNGYNVTRNWYLDIDCDTFYDLNFCSTFLEISTELYNAKCTVKYSQDFVNEKIPTTNAVIRTCNVTRFWNDYDADVDKVCAYLGPEMGRYSLTHSNVFCYICNPSEPLKSNVISTCNVTGKWNILDQGLKDACEHYPVAHSEQPYKNWFCRMCNQNNLDPSTIALMDGSIKVEYKTVADWFFLPSQQYDVIVQEADIENIVKAFKQQVKLENVKFKSKLERILENDGEIVVNGHTVNITNLLFNDYLRTGSYDICASSLLNVIFTQKSNNCSCDVSCIFKDTDACCPDVRLLTETKCIDQFELSTFSPELNPNKWLVINECPANYTDDVIVYLCQNDDIEAAYQLVPVESKVSKMVFRNIYCAFCHLNKDQADSYDVFMTKVQFYTLRLVCHLPIPFQNEISVERIISRARTGQCVIQYIPADIPVTCDEDKTKGQCNKVNLWTENDADVQWACENTDIFPQYRDHENIFCDVCNPSINMPLFFGSCNMTRNWHIYNPELELACESYPAMQKTLPYKNGLCERCNGPRWSRTFTKNFLPWGFVNDLADLGGNTDSKNTLRSFFTTYDEQPLDDVVPVTCQRHQMYDIWKKKCRDVKCNPGRHLYNDTCKPLLQTTTNLSYSLSLGLQTQINQSGVYITELLEGIRIDVHTYLSQTLHVSFLGITISSFMAMSHIACPNRSSVLKHGENLDILLSTQFEIDTEFINRFEAEKNLVELPGQTMDVRHLNKVFSFKMSTDPKAFTLPILIRKTSLLHKCYIKQTSPSQFSPHRSFRRSQVSELLQCKQIYLNADEYVIDEDGMTLTFAGSDAVVKYPEFELISNGQVRICASELPSPAAENDLENALRIFTLVFVCMSLVCLLITFVPYIKFDYLRTLPGLNTVGLMTSLFLVQLMFIIQTFTTTEDGAACTVSGILMHVLWLVYLAWTGVGTFHMYRLFVSDDYFSDDARRYTTLRRYASFTVCFALGIVTLNVVLTAVISESIGYGGNICFISSLTGKVLSFIVPVIIIFILNTVFFVVTYRYIKDQTLKCKKVLKDTTVAKDGRSSLQVFLKMFVLSGFTWTLQLIDGFLPLTVFTFIVTFLNASQGVLILYVHRKSFKMKRNRRRPGSTYRGSTSTGVRGTTTNSASTRNTSSYVNTVTESFQNEGFDSVEDVRKPRLSSRPSIVSVTSTSKIIYHADDAVECHSITEDTNECDSIGNATAASDDIGNDRTVCDCIVHEQYVKHPIGDTGVGGASECGNNKAECESIESDDENVKNSISYENNDCNSVENIIISKVTEGDLSTSIHDQVSTEA
ncbi:uncharacterized protein LOC110459296 [Mizuhopecten yessoensis]|uniref:G-protein coupled receptors family 2 profile 2 domain-containing protein n=1 Tax=Mizuhopecten yessoensis TaxID=6573 RepID=A0A210Q4S4_MIZYE|nr:uncharacterized protein LOC110459296 [Mizuhopecten yessoensis]OWF43746.1 hypothetical protein KP79_PYT21936 [Mizuhopecten yessoensis]